MEATDKRSIELWEYLKKKLKPMNDNNYTARKIFDYIDKKIMRS